MSEARKYRRREIAKKDLQQTVFGGKQELVIETNPHKFAVLTERSIDPYLKVTCPFCLGINPLRLFLISTKKGYNRGLGKCQMCGQGVKFRTLLWMHKASVQDYAKWVFEYRTSGFWQKIKFELWSKRLGMMKWTQPFWLEYKRLKGEADGVDVEKEEDAWNAYEANEG